MIAGKAQPRKCGASTVVKLDSKAPGGEDQYVELAREKTDKILVVLAEFGDERHPRAADLGAWDKLQLGWLDYEVVPAGTSRTLDLGPHEYNSDKAQGVVVPLGKTRQVVTNYLKPTSGTKQWWSGQSDNAQVSLTRQVTLGSGTSMLKFNAHWNIEDCGPKAEDACDYAYVQVDDGTGFKAVQGSITKPVEGNGIDGISDGWVPATFDLSQFAGKTVKLRLHYRTDPAVQGQDTKQPADNGWTRDGFRTVGETSTQLFDHYYVASNRQYVSYDKYLQSGPYNIGFPQDRPDWVEHFPYQNGLLVSYWDTAYSENNTSQHPGEGEILPIDSHPQPIYKLDGQPWRGRIQTYDAPFSLEKADSFTLHDQNTGQASYIRGQAAVPVFDDRRSYWSAVQPNVGVKVPNAGVRMEVRSASGTSMKVRISSTK